MGEPSRLDRIFNLIMKRMVATGQAPHYTELYGDCLGVGDILLTTFPLSIGLPLRVKRSGLVSEVSSR
ncbi:MAG: hypothetical protein OEW45_23920 [Deltaproteobacteria bacterium]|nr:hypothetical protein [Deltaproteobacteria bacterium]